MSLNDICYEQIKDSFYYGLFGDFKLIIDKNTGYFNATKLCKDGGKRFDNWIRLDKSKELIKYYNDNATSSDVRKLISDQNEEKLIYNINVHGNKINDTISGTYVYKKLLLDIAAWVSKDFYNKCYDILESYFINEFTVEYKDNKQKLQIKLKDIEKVIEDKNNVITSLEITTKKLENSNIKLDKSNKELDKSNKNLNESVNKLNNTLTNIKPKIITPPPNNNKYSTFTIIKLYKENIDDEYNYYITTVCDRDYNTRINNLIDVYPDLSVVLKLNKVPNSKYLLDKVKNNTLKDVDYNKNRFNLINIKISEFINTIMEIKESIE
ncbi:transcriptional regulator [Mythimna separata entomopoxvirus 'L']|uniref:N1R/p28-like protein n=1 Tax=Mythimna separata entomopoxvirus 'L' TaxID=1293572 RepID=A0A916KQG7_9POXV|nr:transcriptional regulator [Mythimna separata entomopoxvirus 'L']YP_008003823.1 transcriptional regulator [Mythimna separata entomopoxvirus 'L']CCU56199.1 N1R/p28-like protein [Mythimna separata entomopoxvirus 'L']CCU56504.1 N1R/p28-like protein [Mythimna separata entomopoxvirus 'L']